MAVRTAYVPVAGTAITASNHAKFPGGWIGYVEVTGNQTGISSITDLTSLTLTVTAGTSRRLMATGYCRATQNTTSGATSALAIRNGSSTTLAQSAITNDAGYTMQHTAMRVETPSSGSNTYKLSLSTTGGTVDLIATSTGPAFILVEDIGPAS